MQQGSLRRLAVSGTHGCRDSVLFCYCGLRSRKCQYAANSDRLLNSIVGGPQIVVVLYLSRFHCRGFGLDISPVREHLMTGVPRADQSINVVPLCKPQRAYLRTTETPKNKLLEQLKVIKSYGGPHCDVIYF